MEPTQPVSSIPTSTAFPSSPQTPIKQKTSPIIIIAATFVLLAAAAASAYLYIQNQSLKSQLIKLQSTPIPTPTPADSMANWKIYTDSNSGFTIKYPSDYLFNSDVKQSDKSRLSITSRLISEITDASMNFTKEVALKDEISLQNGNYGEHVDWPTSNSEKVVTLDGVNAKTYLVLGRFDVCDVSPQRTAILYHNNYQINITLAAPSNIARLAPDYFRVEKAECGDVPMWKADSTFYTDLVSQKAPISIQNWYNSFDQILSTFKFVDVQTLGWETYTFADWGVSLKSPFNPAQSNTLLVGAYINYDRSKLTVCPNEVSSSLPSNCTISKKWGQKEEFQSILLGGKAAISFFVFEPKTNTVIHVIQTTQAPIGEIAMRVDGAGLEEQFQQIISTLEFMK